MCQARISGIYVQILCKRLTEHLFEKRKRVVTLSIYNSSLFSEPYGTEFEPFDG